MVLLLVLPATAFQATTSADQFHRTLDDVEHRRLNVAQHVLLMQNGGSELSQRVDAASVLLDLNSSESIPVLNQALRSGRSSLILAVVMADADRPTPAPDLLPTLLAILPLAPENTVQPIGVLLARYQVNGYASLPSLATIALGSDHPLEQRVRVIQALAAFRVQPDAAIDILVSILEQRDHEDKLLIETAASSLEILTGLPERDSPEDWIEWWSKEQALVPEERLRRTIEALHRHAVKVEHELQIAQASAVRSSTRLLQAYQNLFPLLSLQQQQAKVLELLVDERIDVRGYAIERVAVMLRDGHDTTEIQNAVAMLLSDPDTNNRRRVAKLLKELGHEDVETIVLTQLETEQDSEVLKDTLIYLGGRRSQAALPTARRLLADPRVREIAAQTLRSILQDKTALTQAEREEIARAARNAMAPSTWTSIAPLLVLTGNEDDLQHLEVILDNPDPVIRESIGEAFYQRGWHEPLLARADDEVLYPYSLQAAHNRVVDLRTLRTILDMVPSETQRDAWADAVAESTSNLPVERILEIDSMLGATPHADDALRIRVLNAAVSEGMLELELQRRILKRLVPMLLEQDSSAAALTLIQGLDETMLDEELLDMKFISAIRSRLYDDAAQVHESPLMWIRAYEDTLASRPESALDLRNEIVRRYNTALTAEMRTKLGLADDPLMPRDEPTGGETSSTEPNETADSP